MSSNAFASAWTFTPPLVKVVPPYGPDATQAQFDLWRHYENRERAVNVWILSDGSVVQSDPTAENSNVDMSNVLPGDSLLGNQPYVTSIYIDSGANPQSPTILKSSSLNADPGALNFSSRLNPYQSGLAGVSAAGASCPATAMAAADTETFRSLRRVIAVTSPGARPC